MRSAYQWRQDELSYMGVRSTFIPNEPDIVQFGPSIQEVADIRSVRATPECS